MEWLKSTRKQRRLLGSESGSTSGFGNTFYTGLCCPLSSIERSLGLAWPFKKSQTAALSNVYIERNGANKLSIVGSYFEK